MASRDVVKPNFQTGDEPTQAQFYQLFDLLRFLDDPTAIADVTGLMAALNTKLNSADYEGQLVAYDAPATYNLTAGYLLEKIIPFYGVAGGMQISRVTMGDAEVIEKDDVDAGWNPPVQLDIFSDVAVNIYIDGIPAGSKILFLKRKIKLA